MAIEGLAAIKKFKQEQREKEEARNRPKAEYLSSVFPKKTGDVITGQFLQELDKGSTNYDPERGLGLLLKEHEPPGRDGFKRRANCTNPEEDGEDCYGCERKKIDFVKDAADGNWKTKTNLYINFATVIDGEKKVFVLSRNASTGFFDQILQEIEDEGTLLGTTYRITKSGSGTQTNWTLKAVKDEMFDTSDLEVFDLKETVERDIAYEDQAEYYGAVWSGRGKDSAPSESKSAKVDSGDDEW
jgi:hypothetical protein